MRKRKRILIIVSVLLFTCINVAFNLLEFFRSYLLLYIAIVNGVVLGYITGHFANKIFEKKEIIIRFFYIGLVIGMFLSLLGINNQISIELYINKNDLALQPPYIDYVRFYLMGLILGIVKSFYYAIVPSVALFTAIGFLLEKIRIKRGVKRRRA